MKILYSLRRLFCRKNYDLPVFSQQTAFIKQASAALVKMTQTTDIQMWKNLEKEVKACEVQADALLPDFYEELYTYFYTNSVRVDLQYLANINDDFLDYINTCAKSFLLYSPEKIDSLLVDLVQYINAQSDALYIIMSLINQPKTNYNALIVQCDRITELEHAADEAYEDYIDYIFKHEKNAIELMKYKNIAEVLESCTDVAKTISEHIKKMLLRYD